MARKLGLAIDPRRRDPLYLQIFEAIAARIREGTFVAGQRLPPTRALSAEIGAHRNTVVRAYENLEAAGFVTSTVGRGTFVANLRRSIHQGNGAPGPSTRGDAKDSGARPNADDGATGPRARSVADMPWLTLVAQASTSDSLSRFDRLQAHYGPEPRDAVQLARLAPSNDLLPSELLRRCFEHVFRKLGSRALGYAPRDGVPRLRALIAEDLRAQGVPATPEQVLVTNGSQQAIDLIVRLLVNPGDPFFVDGLTYTGVTSALLCAGARPIAVPSDGEGPNIAFLDRHARSGAKGFYLMPSSQNPTGASLSSERREELVAWSRRAGVPLVEDDYAGDIMLGDEPAPPSLRALDRDVIHVGTFSKKLVPALRIGFILSPEPLRGALVTLKHALDLGASGLVQNALAEFLERGYLRAHLARANPIYRARRDALDAALAAHLPRSYRWRRPEQGLLLWLPLPHGASSEAVAHEARRRGVLVGPSTLFAVGPEEQPGLRLSFSSEPEARLVEGARRLARTLTGATLVARSGSMRGDVV